MCFVSRLMKSIVESHNLFSIVLCEHQLLHPRFSFILDVMFFEERVIGNGETRDFSFVAMDSVHQRNRR